MTKNALPALLLSCLACTVLTSALANPLPNPPAKPLANTRSSGQNYKDMMLLKCLSRAYPNDSVAANDTGASAAAMLNWMDVELDASMDASEQLLNSTLAQDYRHPLEKDYKNIRFDALKCLDMYHSKALTNQVKRFVSQPGKPYRSRK